MDSCQEAGANLDMLPMFVCQTGNHCVETRRKKKVNNAPFPPSGDRWLAHKICFPNNHHSGFDWSDRRSGALTSQKVSACPHSSSKRSAFCFNLSRHGSGTPPPSESKRSMPALLPLSAPRPSLQEHRHLASSLWRTCWSHTALPLLLLTCEAKVHLRALPRASQSGKAPLTLNNTGGEWKSQVVALRWRKLQNELSLAPLEEVAISPKPRGTTRRTVTQSLLRELAASEGRRIGHAAGGRNVVHKIPADHTSGDASVEAECKSTAMKTRLYRRAETTVVTCLSPLLYRFRAMRRSAEAALQLSVYEAFVFLLSPSCLCLVRPRCFFAAACRVVRDALENEGAGRGRRRRASCFRVVGHWPTLFRVCFQFSSIDEDNSCHEKQRHSYQR